MSIQIAPISAEPLTSGLSPQAVPPTTAVAKRPTDAVTLSPNAQTHLHNQPQVNTRTKVSDSPAPKPHTAIPPSLNAEVHLLTEQGRTQAQISAALGLPLSDIQEYLDDTPVLPSDSSTVTSVDVLI